MIPAGRQIVDSPDFTPLPYGLFSVVQEVPGPDHWAAGVMHQPVPCGAARTTIAPCPVAGSLTKAPSATGLPIMGSDPFTVYSYIECGPIGHSSAEWEQLAIATLEYGEERAVEATFWTGSVSTTGAPLVSPHLAEDVIVIDSNGAITNLVASPVTTGTAVDVVEAMGALEGALASCYGGVGVLHVPRAAVAHMSNKGLVHDDGTGRLRTVAGTLVAAGGGYPGTSPAGTSPGAGFAWFYITGAVRMYRSSASLTSSFVEAIDKDENDLVLVAERTYVLTWDCCLFGAQVRLGGFDSGSIGSAD